MHKEWYDKNKKKAMYRQLYDFIVREINDGVYKDGEQLPSRRKLAKIMNVSEMTVSNAYILLENTGYVKSNPRKGYFVKSTIKIPTNNKNKKMKLYLTGHYIEERMTDNMADKSDVPKYLAEKIAFSHNGTDVEHFNRSAYAKIVRDIVYNDEKNIFRLGDKYGEPELRHAIAKYLYSFRGIKCDSSKIIIGAGAEYMLVSLAMVLKDGLLYALESPGEMRPYYTLADNRLNVAVIPSGNVCSLRKELEKIKANVFYSFPNFHFPDGYVMSNKQKKELIDWVNDAPDRYIIEDDRDFGLTSHKADSLFKLANNNRIIYMGTFQHSMGSEFKLSYMILPDEIFIRWLYGHVYYYSLCPKLAQYALAEFIEKGEFIKHLDIIKKSYDDKRSYFKNLLEDKFGKAVTVSEKSDSTSLIVQFNIELSGSELRRVCAADGIKIYNISMYTPLREEENEPPACVFGIGHLNKKDIKYGVDLLWDTLKKYID